MPTWAPVAVIFVGAAVLAGLYLLNRDQPGWRSAGPVIAWRVLFLIGLGIFVAVVLILNTR